MNITIDQGNTRTKVAVFDGNTEIVQGNYVAFSIEEFEKLLLQYPIKKGIYSNSGREDSQLLQYIPLRLTKFIRLDHNTKLPITLKYKTPNTLGKDRIAAAVGAHYLSPNSSLLVIDIGTCITYDLVSAEGAFEGGNIAPGYEMRLKSMHEMTACLPLLEPTTTETKIGLTTPEAMINGAYWGIVHEIEGYINNLTLKNGKFDIFLTGGNAFYFEKQIKNCIFATQNLVHIGLNQILIHNDE